MTSLLKVPLSGVKREDFFNPRNPELVCGYKGEEIRAGRGRGAKEREGQRTGGIIPLFTSSLFYHFSRRSRLVFRHS